jgi:hypothetical protein
VYRHFRSSTQKNMTQNRHLASAKRADSASLFTLMNE